MKQVIIIEGVDGTGKTTLANALAEKTKGHVLHCSYHKSWNIKKYHETIIKTAIKLIQFQDVIIDRWAVSEYVYGTVYRNDPSYKTDLLIEKYQDLPLKWIYCRNDNAVSNHQINKKNRKEMFSDISKATQVYDEYVDYTSNNWIHLPWITYDFTKNNINEFIERIIK